mgnify:CR=1 FL=1
MAIPLIGQFVEDLDGDRQSPPLLLEFGGHRHRIQIEVGGIAFIGETDDTKAERYAESLARVSSAFVPIRFQGAIVYQKPEEAVKAFKGIKV